MLDGPGGPDHPLGRRGAPTTLSGLDDQPSLADRLREQRARHRSRSRAFRVPVAFVGFAVLLLGIALLVLPGPGWLLIVFGLGLLALEFAWAERILVRAVDRLEAAKRRAARTTAFEKALGFCAGLAALIAGVAVILLFDVPLLPF